MIPAESYERLQVYWAAAERHADGSTATGPPTVIDSTAAMVAALTAINVDAGVAWFPERIPSIHAFSIAA